MQLLIPMIRMCPLCGKSYGEPPAISRTDNETPICPDCGTRQALSSMGVSDCVKHVEQQEIIDIIHRNQRRNLHNSARHTL